jgi:diadenosine tetraphosphatase ApaH/serine/threonine PP2A family protein phosphatase
VRIAIISDIHANLIAFETVLADSGPVDAVWCLGDLVGYGPRPRECIALLQTLPSVCIVGNHDYAALGRLNLEDFNPVARFATAWTAAALGPADVAFLTALPTRIIEDPVTLVHGSPRQPVWEYIYEPETAQANFGLLDTTICFLGHTHVCSLFQEEETRLGVMRQPRPGDCYRLSEGRALINPGSVGQPRDGDPRAAYAIYDSAAGTVEFRRVAYDIVSTQQQMLEAELPLPLVRRLAVGY